MRRVSLIIGVLAIGLAIAGYVFFNGERRVPVRYRTVPVERGTVISLVTATGTINPITTIQVGSQVSGMIESLHADFNSKVKAHQVVARIDPFPYQARSDSFPLVVCMPRPTVCQYVCRLRGIRRGSAGRPAFSPRKSRRRLTARRQFGNMHRLLGKTTPTAPSITILF